MTLDAQLPAVGDVPEGVPRRNGELVFEAPWESRAFGLAAAYVEASGVGWGRFRQHLIAVIDDLPRETPYDEAWFTAQERLLGDDSRTPAT